MYLKAEAIAWARRVEELAREALERAELGDLPGMVRAFNRLYYRELRIIGSTLPVDDLARRVITPGAPERFDLVELGAGELDTPELRAVGCCCDDSEPTTRRERPGASGS